MNSYSPVGDLTVISICFVVIILIAFSYVKKNRSFRIFSAIVGLLIFAASADVTYYTMMKTLPPEKVGWLYAIRCVFHVFLFLIFVLFTGYICDVTRLEQKKTRIFMGISTGIFWVVIIADIVTTFTGHLSISGNRIVRQGQNIFVVGYIAFILLMLFMVFYVRRRMYVRVMLGFYGSIALSFTVLLVQGLLKDSSYTVATFFYPVLAMFYSLHSNPYDVQLGAVDGNAFFEFVKESRERNREFVFLSLYLKPFAEEGTFFPDELQTSIRMHSAGAFRQGLLFQVEKGHIIMTALKDRNRDYEQRLTEILEVFQKEYERFQFEYKLVVGESIEEISRSNEYVSFIHSIWNHMEDNSIRRAGDMDVKRFHRSVYIQKALEDIYRNRNLDDPRVLTYCQPVYNIKTGSFDTAEALMRLELDGEIFYPDEFIPIAEQNGYIHILTEIILYKTCREIRHLLDMGYAVSRISVNVSALELKEESFCDDVMLIIQNSRIPRGKIAIELTESQTDRDFLVMKRKITELKQQGIIFYLDDFGTGYSNMKRIMELPFDIIKFDRSLVLASGNNDRSRKIVIGLASIFASMNYAVLYEGIEKGTDEEMCIEMSASYLQGYKYSRPIPIRELEGYFEKKQQY